MATIKKGMLTSSKEWAKHLRHGLDRLFWKKERAAERRMIRQEAATIGRDARSRG